ncbi:MAG: sulfotransferase [Mariprofundaceae bacterium]|nr:sulfotransferase [Mariprofundaceae bacterium]
MNSLSILRNLYAQQQYQALKDACLAERNHDLATRILLVLACVNLGELDGVEDRFQHILEQESELDDDALCDLAAAFIVRSQLDEAMQRLNTVLANQSQHALALARLALCHLMMDELELARDCFSRSADLEPGRIVVWTNLAAIQCQFEQYEQAQHSIDQGRHQVELQADNLSDLLSKQYRERLRALQLQLWIETEQQAEAEHWFEILDEHQDEEQSEHWRNLYAKMLAERDLHDEAVEVIRAGLKQYPKNNTLLMQLSELAQLQGHSVMAMNILQRAIAQDKDNPMLWVKFSGSCLHQLEAKARKAAEKAVELADKLQVDDKYTPEKIAAIQLHAKHALAEVESQEQNFELADDLFREVLAIDAHFVPALRGLGQQQMQRGKIDDAVALFERVKLIDPISGHSALINARHFPEDEETLAKMDEAARTPSMEGSARTGILFQLAAAWEKRKDYDKAFAYAAEANQLSKRFVKYDGKDHRNKCARIRHAFSKGLYDARSDCGVKSSLPVYVLGMPRSGTTLVEQIIAGHSQIFGAGELGVIPNVVQGLNRWERHVGSGRHYPDCMDDMNAYITEGIANNVLKELQEYDPKAKHVVDKMPHNFENIGLIKFLFPNAKIISVRRDPRDIAMSNFFTDYQAKHGGMGFAYDLSDTGEQLADHNLMMHYWNELFPNEILEINYEDVVEDTEGAARKMLQYIGVDWEPEVLAFNKLDRPVKTASVWQVRQPIYKTSKAKWKRYQSHLAPLIAGTNARIESPPITDMLSLPEPSFLQGGFALYQKKDLDGAEYKFKQMLHHNPNHAACNYMVGEICLRKNHIQDGIKLIEKALKNAPWKREWTENLLKAYELTQQDDKAEALTKRYGLDQKEKAADNTEDDLIWGDIQSGQVTG